MSLIEETEMYLTEIVCSLGYQIDLVKLEKSKMPLYGEYQINTCMQLASLYKESPRALAEKIVSSFDDRFINVNIQGPGFINISFSDQKLLDNLNKCIDDFSNFIGEHESKKVVLDYGGANIAKELHVGHLRCNIGEAIRRLYKLFGDDVVSDVHWGDWGKPLGLVIKEIKERMPDLPYFQENYNGEYPSESPVTNDDLGVIYPLASKKEKEDENYQEEARILTEKLQSGESGIKALWEHIVNVSKNDCMKVYNYLNCHFDYSYGESDAHPYTFKVVDYLKSKNLLSESNGAKVFFINESDDNKEMPPLMIIKSNGAVAYDTTDLGTIMQRMEDFNPDAIFYFVDERQSLHFEQIFRGSYKSGMVPKSTDLKFYGFGTINGPDGKPFKTRDGGIMSLKGLIKLVYDAIEPKIKENIIGEERDEIANKLTVATLKYSDLIPSRKTDYIFDIDKFTSLEGKTGIYAVYTATRMKSLLKKVDSENVSIKTIPNQDVRDILIKITELPRILLNSYNEVQTSYICEFIYEICSLYNKFYTNNNVLNECDEKIKESFIAVTKLSYNTLHNLLGVLGIEEVERM